VSRNKSKVGRGLAMKGFRPFIIKRDIQKKDEIKDEKVL